MSLYNNIEKIKYSKNTSEVVNLKEYILFENEREEIKYIVFKFSNEVNQQLLGMEFEVSQYNLDGALIETSIVIYDKVLAKANEDFVPNAKLKVNYGCKTISVRLLKAAFDKFLWNEGEYEDNSYKFDHYYRDEHAQKPAPAPAPVQQEEKPKKEKKKKIGKKFELKQQTRKNIARFPAFFLALIFIAVSAFVGVSLYLFERDSKRFTIDGFKLCIAYGKNVSIYGYVGNDKVVEIPQTLGEYYVITIESGAFTDCKMERVEINASLTIEPRAFVNCKKLKVIYSSEDVKIRIGGVGDPADICKGCSPELLLNII
ncbi:MAG: hypothetical protein J1G05_03945 [Clostridiales bacterium]|nr:hypothetical protein [Clostridiales bacterium]